MNYLPVTVESDIIFRENSWTRQFTFNDPSYLTGKTVHIAFWVGNRMYNELYEITPSGGDVVLSLTADEVRSLPAKFEYYLLIDDDSICGGNVSVRMGTGSNTSGVTQITINGDHVTTIQIPGYSVVAGLVSEAIEAKEGAEAAVISAAGILIDVQEVRDQVTDTSPAVVATHAAMMALVVSGKPRQFQVTTDEVGGGSNVNYFWNGAAAAPVGGGAAKATTPEAIAGTNDDKFLTPLGGKALVSDNTTLQPEIVAYKKAIDLVGSISPLHLNADNELIRGLKHAGIFAKARLFMPFHGNNLASALIPLIGSGVITKVGTWDETHYNEKLGIYPGLGNTTRHLALPVNMTGLAYNNISYGCSNVTRDNTEFGRPLSLFLGTATDPLALDAKGIIYNAVSLQDIILRENISLVSAKVSDGVVVYNNGIYSATTTIPSSFDIAGEWRMYYRHDGTNPAAGNYKGAQRVGFVWIGEGLTKSETRTLSFLIDKWHRDSGRLFEKNKENAVFIGDSITNGTGASPSLQKWADVVGRALNYNYFNAGISASKLSTSNVSTPSALARITDLSADNNISVAYVAFLMNDMNTDANANGNATLLTTAQTNLEAIINHLKSTGIFPIVIGVSYTATPSETKLTAYNDAAQNAAINSQAVFVDVADIMLDEQPYTNQLSDAIHPNSAGYATMASQIISRVNKGLLVRKPTLDFPSISAGASATLTVRVRGAAVGSRVDVTPMGALESGLSTPYGYVSSANTVTVQVTNLSASPINPASLRYNVTVTA